MHYVTYCLVIGTFLQVQFVTFMLDRYGLFVKTHYFVLLDAFIFLVNEFAALMCLDCDGHDIIPFEGIVGAA